MNFQKRVYPMSRRIECHWYGKRVVVRPLNIRHAIQSCFALKMPIAVICHDGIILLPKGQKHLDQWLEEYEWIHQGTLLQWSFEDWNDMGFTLKKVSNGGRNGVSYVPYPKE